MWRAWRAGRVSHGLLALNPRAEAKLGRPTRPEQAAAAPYVDGPVIVDNDVNWAARAEGEILGTTARDEFAYIFLARLTRAAAGKHLGPDPWQQDRAPRP